MRTATVAACLIIGLLGIARSAMALEEQIQDLSASVEVAAVFQCALDNSHLAFGSVTPGQPATLGAGGFFNELRCRANAGRPWYLKAELRHLKHVETNQVLAPETLAWRVAEVVGEAEPIGGRIEAHPFSEEPVLVYTSAGDDQKGGEVILRFQYTLTTPPTAPAGAYAGEVIFTMAETP